MKFLYRAKNESGDIVTGTVTARNEFEAEKALLDSKLYALDLISNENRNFFDVFQSKITTKDRAVFARQLAIMISAGMTLTRSLSIVVKQGRTDRLKRIYHTVYQDLEEGTSFSMALAKHPEVFDRIFIAIVRSGETTGNIAKVLSDTADRLENENNFMSKIKGAMLYPAFIFCALLIIGSYLLIKIIPQLATIFAQSGTELPLATKVLIALSGFLSSMWWVVLLAIVVAVFGFRFWIRSDFGERTISHWQIVIPGIRGLSIGIYMNRFSLVMEMLINSGVPLIDALKIVGATINNQIFEEEINQMVTDVEKGVPLSVPMIRSTRFPPFVGQMVSVGEQTGQLDKVLSKVSEYYREETDNRIKALSTLIEPIILLIVGFGVAFLVFAVLMPIYGIAQIQ